MKQVCLFTLFICIIPAVYSQSVSTDCIKFISGDFIYRDSTNGNLWTIKRTAKRQTELNKKENIIIKHKIKWLSPCEYQLTQVWTNNKRYKSGNYKTINYSIFSTNGESYSYKCNCSDGSTFSGTVVKLPGN